MWKNDTIGDCAFASRAAIVSTWTKNAQADMVLTDEHVVQDYAQCTGYNVETGTHDNGTVLLDALNMWRQEGYNRAGQTRDYLTAYGSLDHRDHDVVRRCIYVMGGVYVGITVPQYLMTETGDWVYDDAANWTIIGGHCIAALGYDEKGLIIFTWGGVRHMAWELWDAIVDECYGLISLEDQMTIHEKTNIGFDLQGLYDELMDSVDG